MNVKRTLYASWVKRYDTQITKKEKATYSGVSNGWLSALEVFGPCVVAPYESWPYPLLIWPRSYFSCFLSASCSLFRSLILECHLETITQTTTRSHMPTMTHVISNADTWVRGSGFSCSENLKKRKNRNRNWEAWMVITTDLYLLHWIGLVQ